MSRELFDRRVLAIAIPIAAVSLVGTLIALALGPELFETPGVGPSRSARSAIGHRAFFDLLGSLGIEVETSRANAGHKVRDGALLVFAEPEVPGRGENGDEGADEDEETAPVFTDQLPERLPDSRVLIVLPKWEAVPHFQNPYFAATVTLRQVSEIEAVLEALADSIEGSEPWRVIRPRGTPPWEGSVLPGAPDLVSPQLVHHPRLETWIGATGDDGGTLVGRIEGFESEFIIVSDPDLISNHGLVRGGGTNAVLAVGLIERLLDGPRRVVVDESCHGSGVESGFWNEALRFPLVLLVLHVSLIAGAILWGAFGRFGPPRTETVGYEAGSRRLVESTAELLRFGGHGAEALRRYVKIAVDEACRRLNGPASGALGSKLAWLSGRGSGRVRTDITALAARAASTPVRSNEEKVRELALAIDRWRQEIVHGSERDR